MSHLKLVHSVDEKDFREPQQMRQMERLIVFAVQQDQPLDMEMVLMWLKLKLKHDPFWSVHYQESVHERRDALRNDDRDGRD